MHDGDHHRRKREPSLLRSFFIPRKIQGKRPGLSQLSVVTGRLSEWLLKPTSRRARRMDIDLPAAETTMWICMTVRPYYIDHTCRNIQDPYYVMHEYLFCCSRGHLACALAPG